MPLLLAIGASLLVMIGSALVIREWVASQRDARPARTAEQNTSAWWLVSTTAALDMPRPSLFPLAAIADAEIRPVDERQALERLDGAWRGDGLSIVIDMARSQAGRDPDKPFDRQPFVVRNVTGNVVVFRIGAVDFFAVVALDEMIVTSWEFQGSRTLSRIE